MIDHDRLFKQLLGNFFPEFIELFFPQISADWQPDSLRFLPQEVFTDVTEGEKKISTNEYVRLLQVHSSRETQAILHVAASSLCH